MRCCSVLILIVAAGACSKKTPALSDPAISLTTQSEEHAQIAYGLGSQYLLSQQSDDGAWRREVYGHFKHGDALTPLVIVTLQRGPDSAEVNAAIDRGIIWMMRYVIARKSPKGESAHVIDGELQYPVYTAALTIIALSDPRQQQYAKIRDAWVKYLLSHQYSPANGWSESDWQFGGWGYSGIVPKKQPVGLPSAFESNISATAYALEALRVSKFKIDGEFDRALQFVVKCQNQDGGFIFSPGDRFRNKAGMISPTHFCSYGSATADGLRCLHALQAREAKDERAKGMADRHRQADEWLSHRFVSEVDFYHHGDFMPDREKDRDAAFFYYAAAISEHIGGGERRAEIVKAVIGRQREDGSWMNQLNTLREDDPIVATALAMMALRHPSKTD